MPPKVHLKDLSAAVQSAVEQVLAQHGAVPIEKLWVGFVAPDNLANPEEVAQKVATRLGQEAGVAVQSSVAQISAATGGAAKPEVLPHHILGLVFDPNKTKQ